MNVDQNGSLLPWVGLVTGPIVFLVNVRMSLSTLPWVCATGQYWAVHIAAAASTILILLAGYSAFYVVRRRLPANEETPMTRLDRFMGFMGVLGSAFFTLAIASLWIPALTAGACR